ncbi:MAG: class I SAM-dependent methyltransferase [Pyrinomonadaceae bacterium]
MAKTQKELAFLRDLYVNTAWTKRFTDLADAHLELDEVENLLYLNAGTGDHCIQLREKLDERTAVFGRCDDEDMLVIARDKAAAVKADVDFSTLRFDDDAFDLVLADASFVPSSDVMDFVDETVRVTRTGGTAAFFLPSSGSFGEIFSLLWEVLFNEDLGDHGHAAEEMITDIPTVERIEEVAATAGLVNIALHNAREVFEFANGGEFVASPLVSDFLLPKWLNTMSEAEKERVSAKLSELIDSEDGDMTFRFSVKATLVKGEKK